MFFPDAKISDRTTSADESAMPGWCNETIEATAFQDIGYHMENLAFGIGLGAWLVYGIAVGGHLFITLRFRVKISISLLKRCSLHDIKDTVKNAWTNIGLTTSLVMTTVIGALIEGHEITPQGFLHRPPDIVTYQASFMWRFAWHVCLQTSIALSTAF